MEENERATFKIDPGSARGRVAITRLIENAV